MPDQFLMDNLSVYRLIVTGDLPGGVAFMGAEYYF